MRFPAPLILGAAIAAVACGGRAGPSAGAAPTGPLDPGILRANQAPIVSLGEVFLSDTLLGKRVRVLGWCQDAPGLLAGRRSGVWVLGTADTAIEVRGLVPSACGPRVRRQALVLVFAQVVPSHPGASERLLLRLPE